jgi:hypothetical protein
MKHIFTSVFLFLSIITLNSCGDDGVVKPATTGTPAATVDPNKGCFIKTLKIDSDDIFSFTYNAKNQVEKITSLGFDDPSDAIFTYNTDGTVAKIVSDGYDYVFVYAAGVLSKINEFEGKTQIGERSCTVSGGKVTTIVYSSIEAGKKTLEYTYKFTYSKEGNMTKYIFNIEGVDLDYFSEAVYDSKPNAFSKISKASEAYLVALTDNFLFYPSEFMGYIGSVNNLTTAKVRTGILDYLFSLGEDDVPTLAAMNKAAPLLPTAYTNVINKDNYPTKSTIKYKDPVEGDTSYAYDFTFDCK